MNKVKYSSIIALTILFSFIPLYKAKSRLGINLLNGSHTPDLIEKWTGGLIEADWIDHNYFRKPWS